MEPDHGPVTHIMAPVTRRTCRCPSVSIPMTEAPPRPHSVSLTPMPLPRPRERMRCDAITVASDVIRVTKSAISSGPQGSKQGYTGRFRSRPPPSVPGHGRTRMRFGVRPGPQETGRGHAARVRRWLGVQGSESSQGRWRRRMKARFQAVHKGASRGIPGGVQDSEQGTCP